MDIAGLKRQLLDDHIAGERRLLNPDVEDALLVLVRGGLPSQPKKLAINAAVWGGTEARDVIDISLELDGTLRLEATPPNQAALVGDPQAWRRDVFTAVAGDHGNLSIEQGASTVIQATIGETPNTIAQLIGWQWAAVPRDLVATVWAAPLRFSRGQLPLVLDTPQGNLLLEVDDASVRGWRFSTPLGDTFLVPNGGTWYLVVGAAEATANFATVPLVSAVVGFVLGEQFALGLFRPVNEHGVAPGLINLGRPGNLAANKPRQAPALPFNCDPKWTARLVDSMITLAHSTPDAPIVRSINLYFASASGFIESKFLHYWLALETLARWAIESKRVPDGGHLRLADKSAWLQWVKDHENEIGGFALPGRAQSLVSRVRGAEWDRTTKVQRAFRGLGIEWTFEMADVERVRHGVAHEGAMSDGPIEAKRDRARIGFVNTMLTALLASLTQFEGPIADRSKSHLCITDESVPTWWKPPAALDELQSKKAP